MAGGYDVPAFDAYLQHANTIPPPASLRPNYCTPIQKLALHTVPCTTTDWPPPFANIKLIILLNANSTMEFRTDSHSRCAFRYEPLSEGRFIRVMCLEPALSSTAPIHFSFRVKQLEALDLQYEAISYTWGDAALDYPLYNDDDAGTYVLTTRNLDSALRQLRHSTRTLFLWADAVCINQSDDKEKSIQIPMMTSIYRFAKRVVAWLGPVDEDSDEEKGLLLFDQLSRLPRWQALSIEDDMAVDSLMDSDGHGNDDSDHDEADGGGSISLKMPGSISQMQLLHANRFVQLPWFRRLWIIQELVMNTDVLLICGGSSISWLRLSTVLSALRLLPGADQGQLMALERIASLWAHHCTAVKKDLSASREAGRILDLVETFSDYGCSDPRDRIYALYSLATNISPTSAAEAQRFNRAFVGQVYMDVDYSSGTAHVYQEFATACVNRGMTVQVLQAVLLRQHLVTPSGWPSWVPDWRKSPTSWLDRPSWPYELPMQIHARPISRPGILRIEFTAHCINHEYPRFADVVAIHSVNGTADSAWKSLRNMCQNKHPWCIRKLFDALTPLREPFECELYTSFLHYPHNNIRELPPHVRKMTEQLQDTMRNLCFFTSRLRYAQDSFTDIVGIGNIALRLGDKVAEMDCKFEHGRALLLRRESDDDADRAHRLIGSARFVHFDKRDRQEPILPRPKRSQFGWVDLK